MVNIAVLGYGTVGSGVVEVINTNHKSINKRAGAEINIKYVLRICDRNNKLICTHRRSYKDFPKYITKPEHMAPEHQYYKEVNSKDGAYYRRWASSIGPYMGKLIDSVLLTPQHEEQAYNSCNGILHMCKNQSRLLLEDIAKTCVESNACRYSYFKKLLKNMQDNHSVPTTSSLPEHSNLRGKEEYR